MPTLRQKRELDFTARLDRIAAAVIKANKPAVLDATREAIARVREYSTEFKPITDLEVSWIADVAAFEAPTFDELADVAIGAARVLSAVNLWRVGGKIVAKNRVARFDDMDDLRKIDPLYARAAAWMRKRRLMTKAELADAAQALAILSPQYGMEEIERELRRHVTAYAGAPTKEMARVFRDSIARSVGRGETLAEFLDAMDAEVAAGRLLPQMDAYLETVYRTETSLAYSEQRRRDWAHPDVAPFVWGRQLYNGLLPSSRPSHVALNGLKLQRGSAADNAAGHPPYSYNCTCTEALLIVADPATANHVEPEDALSRVAAIERF